MAVLRLENDTVITDLPGIAAELGPLGVTLEHRPTGDDPAIRALLEAESLTDPQKAEVLAALDHHFEALKATRGYQTRDLIVLQPLTPGLDGMLSRFDKAHTHSEDEVRYIVAGEGVFGFVRLDGSQVELTVQPDDFIGVPTGTEHWFRLTGVRAIKAVRYFTSTEGWTPDYTGTPVRFATSAPAPAAA